MGKTVRANIDNTEFTKLVKGKVAQLNSQTPDGEHITVELILSDISASFMLDIVSEFYQKYVNKHQSKCTCGCGVRIAKTCPVHYPNSISNCGS